MDNEPELETHDQIHPARKALLWYMEFLSENYWCAGWISNLEFHLWKEVLCWREGRESGQPYLAEHAEVLSWLAEQAGGWWVWDDNADEEPSGRRFLANEEWLDYLKRQ